MFESTKALCQVGHLGHMEMIVLYGCRDSNGNLSVNAYMFQPPPPPP